MTAVKILPFLSEKVSLRTLKKSMKADKDLSYKNVPKRICLTGSQKLKRCEVIRSWIRRKVDFETVLLTDEVRFSVDGPDNFMSWLFRTLLSSKTAI